MPATRTSLYLEQTTQAELREAARRLGKTQTWVVQEALSEYLAKVDRPRLGSIGAGEDTEVAAETAKRWVRRRWSGKR
jgi:hypothetical protein